MATNLELMEEIEELREHIKNQEYDCLMHHDETNDIIKNYRNILIKLSNICHCTELCECSTIMTELAKEALGINK